MGGQLQRSSGCGQSSAAFANEHQGCPLCGAGATGEASQGLRLQGRAPTAPPACSSGRLRAQRVGARRPVCRGPGPSLPFRVEPGARLKPVPERLCGPEVRQRPEAPMKHWGAGGRGGFLLCLYYPSYFTGVSFCRHVFGQSTEALTVL